MPRRLLAPLAATALLVAGCTSGTAPTEPRSPSSAPGSPGASPSGTATFAPHSLHGRIDPLREGAVGDGRTDDTAALQAVLDAMAQGSTLVLPRGATFAVSDVLRVSVPRTTITGQGTLLATKEARSSLLIDHADDVTVEGITLAITATTQRWSAYEQQRLHVDGGQGLVLRNLTIRGSAAAGIYVGGSASGFTIEHVSVSGTRADGIHMTQGANDGTVRDVRIDHSGDDGVAVVSYAQDGIACHDITITRPVVHDGAARGISVVGGTRISYHDIDVTGSAAAAVYIASESSYDTAGVQDVTVDGGTVRGANTSVATDHGAILLFQSSGRGMHDVVVRDLDVTGTRASASRQVGVLTGGPGEVSDVTLDDLHLEGGPAQALVVDGPVPGLAVRGWTVDGAHVSDPEHS